MDQVHTMGYNQLFGLLQEKLVLGIDWVIALEGQCAISSWLF